MQRFKRSNAIAAGIAGVSLLAFSALTAKAQTMSVPSSMGKTATSTVPGDMMADKLQGLPRFRPVK